MKKLVFMSLVLALSLGAGCAKNVHKDWFAYDGSRSDATVKLAITWNPALEIPQDDREQADALAAEKCKVWGYEGGGIVRLHHPALYAVCQRLWRDDLRPDAGRDRLSVHWDPQPEPAEAGGQGHQAVMEKAGKTPGLCLFWRVNHAG